MFQDSNQEKKNVYCFHMVEGDRNAYILSFPRRWVSFAIKTGCIRSGRVDPWTVGLSKA